MQGGGGGGGGGGVVCMRSDFLTITKTVSVLPLFPLYGSSILLTSTRYLRHDQALIWTTDILFQTQVELTITGDLSDKYTAIFAMPDLVVFYFEWIGPLDFADNPLSNDLIDAILVQSVDLICLNRQAFVW